MNLNITYSALAKAIDGNFCGADASAVLNNFTIDSRAVQSGTGFWVIKGRNHDAHKFAVQAAKGGAALIIGENGRLEEVKALGVSVIEVEDTLKALQKFASYHRLKHNIKIAAITGSNGKSTTKQMLLSIASADGKTCANSGNFNNQIGVPLSLLEINTDDVYGVFELGASHKGDIDEIASIALPDVAVLTNVSAAHLEFFGDLETVYQTKTEIIKSLNSSGTLVYNIDDELLRRLKTEYTGKAISYGFSSDADLRIEESEDFAFTYKGARFSIPIKLERHNKFNAAAACGAAIALGLFKDEIERGLQTFSPMPLRLEEHKKGDTTFILDCYNANPASVGNALDILVSRPAPHIAVLGDMKELGAQSAHYHAELGRKLAASGIKTVFLAGEEIKPAYDVLLKQSGVMVKYSVNWRGFLPELKEKAKQGGTVLIKASRALNFEEIFKEI